MCGGDTVQSESCMHGKDPYSLEYISKFAKDLEARELDGNRCVLMSQLFNNQWDCLY